jgi:hypothetical protein
MASIREHEEDIIKCNRRSLATEDEKRSQKLRNPIATLDNTLTKRLNEIQQAYSKVDVPIRNYRPRISTEFCAATQPTQNLKEEETKAKRTRSTRRPR